MSVPCSDRPDDHAPPPRLPLETRRMLDAREPLLLATLALMERLSEAAWDVSATAAVEVGFRNVDEALALLRRAWMQAPLGPGR